MHRSFFAVKDTFINSGSRESDGVTLQDKNVGQDEILELKKVFRNKEFHAPTRMLIQFNSDEVKSYLTSSNVPSDYKLILKLFETAGTSGLSNDYNIAAYPLSESWDEGIGKEADNPKTTVGCSWLNRQNRGEAVSEVTWSNDGGTYISGDEVTQSFSLSSPDIEMDVTSIAKKWFSGENQNHGFLLRFSGSSELSTQVSGSTSQSLDLVEHTLTFATSSISESLTFIDNTVVSSSYQISQSLTLNTHTLNNLSGSISASISYEGVDDGTDDQLITFTVTVVSDGGNKYAIDGITTPNISLRSGNTYRFDQSDSSNGPNHPFRFSETENGSHGGGSEYTTGVTVVGTHGQAGAYTQLVVSDTTPDLYYYCTVHSGMGNDALLTTSNDVLTSINYMSSSISSSLSQSLDAVNHFSSSISSSISQSLTLIQHTTNTTSSSISESIDLTTHTFTTVLSTGEPEDLKFFSRQTNTIYSPKLELRWDDHLPATGSNTGSLQPLDLSGQTENYVYQLHTREAYKETETVKFRFGARKRYIGKSFSTSIQTVSGSYFAEGSASYSIIDMATNEDVIPFSSYTTMSCDPISPYFTQDLNTFEPNRAYKIMLKVNHNDGQTHIYDDGFEFILRT